MRRQFPGSLLAAVVACSPAAAQNACDQFGWPVQRELMWLSSPTIPTVDSGATLAGDGAFNMALRPFASVPYVVTPERAPKGTDTFGGIVTISAPAHAGLYQVTLSEEAWIDVVQAEHRLVSQAFTGKTGCLGVRKSVRFEIGPGPLVIQISGAASGHLAVAAAPAD
jgi:hypothetical protein